MKKYLVLTSVLALTACGGGGGGGNVPGHAGYSTPGTSKPTIHVQGFSGGQTVNDNNASLTNMSSYVVDYGTDENTSKQEMIDYVNAHLGSSRGISTDRSATRSSSMRARDGEVNAADFERADAAITEMKQVLYDMVGKSNDTELRTYVTRYKNAVINALKLYNVDIADNPTIDDLIDKFSHLKEDNTWTTDNIMAALDTFDVTNFHITKFRMEDDVQLKDTGQDAFFKFALDDSGKISSISLWESSTSEYGTSWTADGTHSHDIKIVIDPETGDATYLSDAGLNPFDANYINSDAGDLIRNGTGTAFTNTLRHYEFELGEHTLGDQVIDADEFAFVEINSDTDLTPELAKEKLKNYIVEKVNKKLHNQNGGEVDGAVASFVAVANWYLDRIDEIVDADFVTDSYQTSVAQTVTMNGFGKDVQLKYSDFGYAKMDRTVSGETNSQYLTYAGGYDAYRMDHRPMANALGNATFTGTAIVTVEDHHKNKNTHTDLTNTALYKDTQATLVYNPISATQAQHTLTMNHLTAMEGATAGSQWYNMVVSGTDGSDDMQVTFDADGKSINETFQFFRADAEGNIIRNEADSIAAANQIVSTTGDTPMTIDMVDGTASEDNHRLDGAMTADYYGPTQDDTTEATSGVWMDERWHSDDNNIQHELSVYGAFGGQKDVAE